jgi:hypothetical protein
VAAVFKPVSVSVLPAVPLQLGDLTYITSTDQGRASRWGTVEFVKPFGKDGVSQIPDKENP